MKRKQIRRMLQIAFLTLAVLLAGTVQAAEQETENTEALLETDTTAAAAETEGTISPPSEMAGPWKQTDPDMSVLAAGDILDAADIPDYTKCFQEFDIAEGDEIYNRIIGKSYRENPDIALSDLKYLKVLHYNFSHEIQVGEMIVNADVSEDVRNIFQELYEAKYEIESMYLVDNYWTGDGDSTDTASIDVNNTSAFNYRQITGGGKLSNHALGRAIDINPQQNPYVWYSGGTVHWTHSNADPYIDRSCGDPHVIVSGDTCQMIFEKYGFSWGGDWSDPIDYQHFEKTE